MKKIRKSDYQAFVTDIKEKIREAQYNALKAVNYELIDLNWYIGSSIVEKQILFRNMQVRCSFDWTLL